MKSPMTPFLPLSCLNLSTSLVSSCHLRSHLKPTKKDHPSHLSLPLGAGPLEITLCVTWKVVLLVLCCVGVILELIPWMLKILATPVNAAWRGKHFQFLIIAEELI